MKDGCLCEVSGRPLSGVSSFVATANLERLISFRLPRAAGEWR